MALKITVVIVQSVYGYFDGSSDSSARLQTTLTGEMLENLAKPLFGLGIMMAREQSGVRIQKRFALSP